MNPYNQKKSDNKKYFENYQIKSFKVRLLDYNNGAVILKSEAQHIAETRGLDLVQISYDKNEKLPICKIMDYGKFKYEQSKKEKTQKKLQKAAMVEIKQIQISLTTEENDIKRLINHTKEFLERGDKVRLVLRFRNRRESKNLEFAKSVMLNFLNQLTDVATIDTKPVFSPKDISCIIKPISKK